MVAIFSWVITGLIVCVCFEATNSFSNIHGRAATSLNPSSLLRDGTFVRRLSTIGSSRTKTSTTSNTFLEARPKKKRRRKERPSQDVERTGAEENEYDDEYDDEVDISEDELATLRDVAKYEFKGDPNVIPTSTVVAASQPVATKAIADQPVQVQGASPGQQQGQQQDEMIEIGTVASKGDGSNAAVGNEPSAPVRAESEGAIPLPDIREALRKKRLEEELQEMEKEKEATKVKVKRSDKEAYAKLLEQNPFSDADDSLFEEEAYDAVSAILGERSEKFFGIPTGPLQVSHFIGALGICLMAFIEYPGFPLTNLPTPLRDALQGGLASVYSINLVLAILAVFKAKERGQPLFLWVSKTFSVGGLAFDQLTQLPTLEEIEKAKNKKGKRALKA